MRSSAFSYQRELEAMESFFQGKDQVHKTLRRLVKRLLKAQISYAIVGGMALAAHRYRRATTDVDILLTRDGFVQFQERFVPNNYEQVPGRKRRFVDRKNQVTLDILVTGLFPGSGAPGPVAFPDPAEVGEEIDGFRVLGLAPLIQLKLAARRHRDFGDVVELIRANDLSEPFAEQLHPSVRQDFIECLEEKRREDDYDARESDD